MGAGARNQEGWRGRDVDNVALNGTVWVAMINTGWTQDVDVNFRLRFLAEVAGMNISNDLWEIWFDHESGGMEIVTASSVLQWAPTTEYANGDTTTQVIGGGTYSSADSKGGVDNANLTGNMDLVAGEQLEAEWCLQIDSAQVADEDEIIVEIRRSGGTRFANYNAATEMTFASSRKITVNRPAGGGPGIPVLGYHHYQHNLRA